MSSSSPSSSTSSSSVSISPPSFDHQHQIPSCSSVQLSSTPSIIAKIPSPILGAERFPCSVVWTPIPCITWLLPFVGHMGICNTEGVCYDFAGPYYVSEDELSFGVPARYFSLLPFIFPASSYQVRTVADGGWEVKLTNPAAVPPAKRLADFDRALAKVTDRFRRTMMYNFFTRNCHSFTAFALEEDNSLTSWNMVVLAARMFFTGRFVTFYRFLWCVLPSAVIYGLIIALSMKLR